MTGQAEGIIYRARGLLSWVKTKWWVVTGHGSGHQHLQDLLED
jgi:hypothetical protein